MKLFNALLWCLSIGLWIAVWASGFRDSESPVHVNCVLTDSAVPGHNTGNAATDSCINVNTSGKRQLVLLPGIGPAMAERIIQFRKGNGPFRSLDDLDKVKGIGAGRLEAIRKNVCF